ncbi:MAG: Probable low-affinity inorganic phosphate transporter [uncultured Thiotrichaceae bacterium]|uniref:Probable low-affinity inorganic phosphate transporter n=1 Tax=uncultured Thiotrichaceae bacterium TaxID=298394 RepID=A0A6S6SBM2_9GAMM|nr:MAG: Probable low-affinity inorganic phosphate transporter [uncultured Thiotrichaceae bacterium]
MFTVPLIFSAALLSFAHGANDVANAVGPLAAINDAVSTATIHAKADIPLWVLLIGAVGIALGLALYGPKLIRVVGSEITELDQIRAFCVALAAAVTVIIASQLGLPVSSTHVAVGAVFGVGFLREAIKANYMVIIEDIRSHHADNDRTEEDLEQFFTDFEDADFKHKDQMIKTLKKNSMASDLKKGERKQLKKQHKEELVRRSALYKIAVAWVITVPVSAFMSAMFYFTIRGMLL